MPSVCHDRAGRATGAPRCAATPVAGVARARPVLPLRGAVPGRPALPPRDRRLPGRRRAAHARRTTPTCRRPSIVQRVPDQHRDQPRHRDRRRHLRVPARLRRHPRRAAADPPRRADDVLRASPRTSPASRWPWRSSSRSGAGAPDDRSSRTSASTSSRQRLHALLEARPRDRLSLLPVPADGPDHRARHRRAEARMARGGGEHGRDRRAVLAPRGAADPDADAPRHA